MGIKSKELVHLHLGGLKLAKFVSNLLNLGDQNDVTPQSTEPKVIVSFHEESMPLLGLKWKTTMKLKLRVAVLPVQ